MEKTPTSFIKTKKALGGLALSLALLGGGEIASNQPVEAQATTETPANDVSHSEYAPDCGYGGYPIWRADDNADGQPGPDGGEFVCGNLPGCFTQPVLPFPILEALSRAGLLLSRQYAAISPRQDARTVQCNGVPAITGLEDYEYLLDHDPGILDYITEILANQSFWDSAEVQAQLERFEETWHDDWWWDKVRVTNTPETTPDTPNQTTDEPPQTDTTEDTPNQTTDEPPQTDTTEDTPNQTTDEPPQTDTTEDTPNQTTDEPPQTDTTEDTPNQTTDEPPQTDTTEDTPNQTTDEPPQTDTTEDTPNQTTDEPPQTDTTEDTPNQTTDEPPQTDTTEDTPNQTTDEPPQTDTTEDTPNQTTDELSPNRHHRRHPKPNHRRYGRGSTEVVVLVGAAVAALGLAGLGARFRRKKRHN